MQSISPIAFSTINIDKTVDQLEYLLNENRQKIAALLTAHENNSPSWSSFAEPLEEMNDRLEQFWSPISHLHAVADTEDLRKVYEECLPKLTAYSTELGQNRQLCDTWKALAVDELNDEQQMTVTQTLRDFRLSGVDLAEDKRKRFAELRQELSTLSTKFANNVLDATQAYSIHITNEEELKGVPDSAKALYSQRAKAKQLEGWLIGLDIPAYLPVMQYAESRQLREKLYHAYTTRASDVGPHAGDFNNTDLMKQILSLRHQLAETLGFDNYAELSLASKMADTPKQVMDFLMQLAEKSLPQAKKEFSQLEEFSVSVLNLEKLSPWDVAFATEKLRLAKYDLSQELLRPYFPVDRVLNGFFEIIKRLFDVQFEKIEAIDSWHDDVEFFALKKNSEIIAYTYLDLYSREGKRGGAWMADARNRRRLSDGNIQLPIAFLTCNFTPPEENKPALLTHDEVTTLFHEFGHGLHHMLTLVNVAAVAGINGVPWDAVELPSQFLENWCWEPEAIALFSGHYLTGEALPASLLEKMLAAKHFQSAMQMVRQLEFSLFDLRIHAEYQNHNDNFIGDILQEVRKNVAVYDVPEWNRFANSFSHIFAGGYAAGYYSYKWAEVLSADAFSKFEEEGIFNAETGKQFLECVLSCGGSREPAELFARFRGRAPAIDALLRHSGIQ